MSDLSTWDGRTVVQVAAIDRFDKWKMKRGYELASDGCPWDSEEGEYLWSVDVDDVVMEYFSEHPADEAEFRDVILASAYDEGPYLDSASPEWDGGQMEEDNEPTDAEIEEWEIERQIEAAE